MGHWRLVVATDELIWSDELYRIYGLDPKTTNITRELASSMKLPDDAGRFSQAIEDYKTGKPVSDFEYRLKRTDGNIRHIQGSIQPEYDGKGQIVSFFGISQDITNLKDALNSRNAVESRFKDLIELAADWYWEMDENLAFTYVSERMEEITGLDRKRFIGRSRGDAEGDIIAEGDWQTHQEDLINRRTFRDFRYRYKNEKGQLFYWSASGKPVFNENGDFAGYRGTGTDITAQTVLEDKLRQSQKLQAIGQLTGGVAHDFNNILAIIVGNAELVRERILQKQPIDLHIIDAIIRSVKRGSDLTSSLLAFSRKQDLQPDILCLNEGLSSFSHILKRAAGEAIDLTITHQENLWRCRVDSGQMENAVLNLVLNARDALPSGGSIHLQTANISLDEAKALDLDIELGDYVTLAVRDTGTGIPEDNLTHVFEPFFTTKEIGKGTGLGLSMVYGFAKQSGGTATIPASSSEGTTAMIYLPRHQEEA